MARPLGAAGPRRALRPPLGRLRPRFAARAAWAALARCLAPRAALARCSARRASAAARSAARLRAAAARPGPAPRLAPWPPPRPWPWRSGSRSAARPRSVPGSAGRSAPCRRQRRRRPPPAGPGAAGAARPRWPARPPPAPPAPCGSSGSPPPPCRSAATCFSSAAWRRLGGLELALDPGQLDDLGLRGVEHGGRPLQPGLQVLRRAGADEQGDRHQVGLLLVLVADHPPAIASWASSSRCPRPTAALALRRSSWAFRSLAAAAVSLALATASSLWVCAQLGLGHVQPGLGAGHRDAGLLQRGGGLAQVMLGLGDLLLRSACAGRSGRRRTSPG